MFGRANPSSILFPSLCMVRLGSIHGCYMKLCYFSNIDSLCFTVCLPGLWAMFIFYNPYFVYYLVVLCKNKVSYTLLIFFLNTHKSVTLIQPSLLLVDARGKGARGVMGRRKGFPGWGRVSISRISIGVRILISVIVLVRVVVKET